MNTYNDILAQLGLSDKESALYVALLSLGSADVATIAKSANVKRPTAYLLLEGLQAKGFVSSASNNGKQTYSAEDPRKLLAIQKAKLQQFEKLMPELVGLGSTSKQKPRVRFFTGIDGIKAIYEESLLQPARSEILAIGNAESVEDKIEDFRDWYIRRRAESGIEMRAIIPSTEAGLKVAARDNDELRTTRTISKDSFTELVEVNIYGNKIAAVSLVDDELIGVVIDSKVLANVHRQIFELLWANAAEPTSY